MPFTTYIALLTAVLGLGAVTVMLIAGAAAPMALMLPASLTAAALLFLARRK